MRRRADMRQQHDLAHLDQRRRDFRLPRENVEPGGQYRAIFEGADQRRLIDHGAARDVDQHAIRSQRRQDLGIDDVARRRAARQDDDQRVDRFGKGAQLGKVRIVDIRLLAARVIGDRRVEAAETFGDHLADPAQADDADTPAAQRGGKREGPAFGPEPAAHEPVGLGQASDGGNQQPDREIPHLVIQHIGRIGHDDAAGDCRLEVDRVIADAEIGDDLQFRQSRDQRRRDRHAAPCRDRGDLRPMRRKERLQRQHCFAIDHETLGQGVLDARLQLAQTQNLDRRSHHSPSRSRKSKSQP